MVNLAILLLWGRHKKTHALIIAYHDVLQIFLCKDIVQVFNGGFKCKSAEKVLSTGLHFINRKFKMPRLFFYKLYQKHRL